MLLKNRLCCMVLVLAVLVGSVCSSTLNPLPTPVPEQKPLVYDFSGATAEANQLALQGAGFGTFPQAGITFGSIPTDNGFVNATDGKGAIIQAKPGEGIMIFLPVVSVGKAAMIRCSVRTTSIEASVYLASIDKGENVFVSTITPNNGNYFLNKWKRIADFCLPPSSKGFQPLLQIINTSKTASLTAYVDNFEVYTLEKGRYYSEEFLNGDETDPDAISIAPEPTLPLPTPTPVVQGTPTPTPVLSQTVTVKLLGLGTNSKPLDMVLIPAGKFTMGAPVTDKYSVDDERPLHQVTITKPFYMGKYEVTQAQWQAVMGSNPSHYKGENLPVEAISWEDTQIFIQKLNQLGLGTFRLPTEAEWEYACRAGTTTQFYWGEDPNYTEISNYAWYYTEQLTDQTHEVGLKKPNPWGLFDMSGNVWEWCQDWYTTPYPSEPQTDPLIPTSTIGPVFRGGSWFSSPWGCRSGKRSTGESGVGFSDAGLRLVRVAQ